jgi:hypothetical protein
MNKTVLFRILFALGMVSMLPVLVTANLTGTVIDPSSICGLSDLSSLNDRINSLIAAATNTGSDSTPSTSVNNDTCNDICNDTMASAYDQKIQEISDGIDRTINDTIASMTAATCDDFGFDTLAIPEYLT